MPSPARVDVNLTDDVRGHLRWVDIGEGRAEEGPLHQATRRPDEAAGRDRDAEQLPAYPAGGCGGRSTRATICQAEHIIVRGRGLLTQLTAASPLDLVRALGLQSSLEVVGCFVVVPLIGLLVTVVEGTEVVDPSEEVVARWLLLAVHLYEQIGGGGLLLRVRVRVRVGVEIGVGMGLGSGLGLDRRQRRERLSKGRGPHAEHGLAEAESDLLRVRVRD